MGIPSAKDPSRCRRTSATTGAAAATWFAWQRCKARIVTATGALCGAVGAMVAFLGWSAALRSSGASPLLPWVLADRIGGAVIGTLVALALEALAHHVLAPRTPLPEPDAPAATTQTPWPLARLLAHYYHPN